VPLHCLDVPDKANWLSLPVNQSRLICTILELTIVSRREEGCKKALCSELVNCDGLSDGDDTNEGRSKYIKVSGVEMVVRVMGMMMVMVIIWWWWWWSCCNYSSSKWNKASRNWIEENAVAAYFIIARNLADVSAEGLVSESHFAFCWWRMHTRFEVIDLIIESMIPRLKITGRCFLSPEYWVRWVWSELPNEGTIVAPSSHRSYWSVQIIVAMTKFN